LKRDAKRHERTNTMNRFRFLVATTGTAIAAAVPTVGSTTPKRGLARRSGWPPCLVFHSAFSVNVAVCKMDQGAYRDNMCHGGTIDHAHLVCGPNRFSREMEVTALGGGGDLEMSSLKVGRGDSVVVSAPLVDVLMSDVLERE